MKTVEMYVTHLGTRVLESVDVDEHRVILYTNDPEVALKSTTNEFDDFGWEETYDWNYGR